MLAMMSTETTVPNRETNIAWVDVLRVLACFMVVLAHCCDPFVAQFANNNSDKMAGIAIGSLVRPCVPLFAMITGFLLFPIKMSTGEFYAKRIKKVVIPLVFWSLVSPLLYYRYLSFVETGNPNIILGDFRAEETLTKLHTFFFNFSYDAMPLWYLYMLIGLYLVMPIFGAWLNEAKQKEVKVFLMLWFFTMILPLVEMLAPLVGYQGNYGSMELLGACLWNPYGSLYYFAGFIGYAVLAYYLKKYPLNWSWTKTLSVTIPLFVAGYLITYFGFIKANQIYAGNYEYLEIPWYFTGFNVFMMTISIYLVVSKINFKASKCMSRLAGLTLGIFLCHFFFVQVVYDYLYPRMDISPYLKILINALVSFVLVSGIVWCLSKNKFSKKII